MALGACVSSYQISESELPVKSNISQCVDASPSYMGKLTFAAAGLLTRPENNGECTAKMKRQEMKTFRASCLKPARN